jgi:hypothetical protein
MRSLAHHFSTSVSIYSVYGQVCSSEHAQSMQRTQAYINTYNKTKLGQPDT